MPSETKQEKFAAFQYRIPERIATGYPLSEILEEITSAVEQLIPGALCSILLVDRDGRRLRVAAGRSLPAEFNTAIDGIDIGPTVDSWGTAVHRQEPVFIADIATDPLRTDFHDLALRFGLLACWFFPVFSVRRGEECVPPHVFGTYGIYLPAPAVPTADEERIGTWAARLTGLVLDNDSAFRALRDREDALRTSETELKSLFASMKEYIFVLDRNGVYRKAAPTNEDALKKVGDTLDRHFPTEVADRFLKTIRQVLDNRAATALEYPLSLNGNERWFSTNVSPLSEDTVLWVARDITDRKRAEEALQQSESRFRQLADASPGVIFSYVETGERSFRFLLLTPAFEAIHEIPMADALRDPDQVLRQFHPDDTDGYWERVAHSRETLGRFEYEWRIRTPSGKVKWLSASAQPEVRENGEVLWHGVALDVTDRKEAEARFLHLAANMPGVIYQEVRHGDGTRELLYISPGCRGVWEQEPETMRSLACSILNGAHPEDVTALEESLMMAVESLQPWHWEWRIVLPSGRLKWLRGSAKPKPLPDGSMLFDGVILDVSEQKRDQELIAYNALHDPLTGLPNRTLLLERLELAIKRARRIDSYGYAVLFLDLDRFKVINDSLGHLAGDVVLKRIARRLQSHLRGVDLVARIGGDEFVILLEDVGDTDQAVLIAERILEDFRLPVPLNDGEVVIDTSIGIAMGSATYRRAAELLRDADIAMYKAKALGSGNYRLFDAEMHIQAVNRLTLETYLRRALEREEFEVYYQPIIDLRRDRLVGFEVLTRLRHPSHGFVAPDEFVPVAEETGLIVPLDQWVLYSACRQMAEWAAYPAARSLSVSINLSAQDLRKTNLINDIDRTMAVTGLAGTAITLEITESMLIENIGKTIELLTQLKEREIRISIDDFGTGYSSLSYLHRLPANSLKIDRSFVGQMQMGNRNYQIVSTIVALSNQLGLDAVAEGIETPRQLWWLRQLGCEFGQGYLFAHPLSAREIEERFLRVEPPAFCEPHLLSTFHRRTE
ncbi:MAG: EAL domain-containing protein [Capsulimonadales bacterium]|nr:EAL domain-containing protein [Capsulimonadales bacterium]